MAATELQVAVAKPAPGLRKAAVLLLTLGEQASGQMLQQLSEADAEKVSREVASIGSVSPNEIETILDEASQLMLAREYFVEGGVEFAQRMLSNAFGPETGKTLLERISKSLGSDYASFDALQKMDPKQIARLIYNEYPQTIALIVSHLVPAQAAALLNALPAEVRADVVKRLACLDHISPEIVLQIGQMIGRRLKSLGELSRESYGGVRAVAEILNRLEAGMSEEILAEITKDDATVAETIRTLMFVFEDVLKMSTEDMRTLVSKLDRKVLATALKGTSEPMRNHFTQTMSQRAGEMLKEDMEALGPVKIKDVDGAQQEVIAQIRKLQAEGAVSLPGAASGDAYVN